MVLDEVEKITDINILGLETLSFSNIINTTYVKHLMKDANVRNGLFETLIM